MTEKRQASGHTDLDLLVQLPKEARLRVSYQDIRVAVELMAVVQAALPMARFLQHQKESAAASSDATASGGSTPRGMAARTLPVDDAVVLSGTLLDAAVANPGADSVLAARMLSGGSTASSLASATSESLHDLVASPSGLSSLTTETERQPAWVGLNATEKRARNELRQQAARMRAARRLRTETVRTPPGGQQWARNAAAAASKLTTHVLHWPAVRRGDDGRVVGASCAWTWATS